MGSTAQSEYGTFEEKVSRTVYLDNLAPYVTESVLRKAFDQYGIVKSVRFIPNYLESRNTGQYALVEMENKKQAKGIVSAISEYPFMVSGMPRPVRAREAEVEMFDDRPMQPGRRIQCRWLAPNDPDFEVARRLKGRVRTHAAEASFLLKDQLAQEEKLHKQQTEILNSNYHKYDLLDSVWTDGTVHRLARRYNMSEMLG